MRTLRHPLIRAASGFFDPVSFVVITTRPLPLPEVSLGGHEVTWVSIDEAIKSDAPSVLLATSLDKVDAGMISALPSSVKLIANLGIGVDHIDLGAAKAHGIKVANTPVVTEDTADLAFALILAACRKVGQSERFVRAGHWSVEGAMAPMGKRVHGSTLGLIGFGAIGQAVAHRACGFGMEILYWNRSAKPDVEIATGAKRVLDLTELVEVSDIVSLHTPLTPDTKHLVDADLLDRFKSQSVLVNTARGPLIDETALTGALIEGKLAAAGLDVFEQEPEIPKSLAGLENVVLTPHIGSATEACRRDIVGRGLANIDAFVRTGSPLDEV